MKYLQSNLGLAGRAGGARAPGLGSLELERQRPRRGRVGVCRNVRRCGGDSDMGCLEVEWNSS